MLRRWRRIGKAWIVGLKWRLQNGWARTPIGLRFGLTLLLLLGMMSTPLFYLSHLYTRQALMTQKRLTQMRQLKTMEVLIERELLHMLHQVGDYGVWEAAHAAVRRRDREWLRTYVTEWLTQQFYYDVVAVFDMQGRVLAQTRQGLEQFTRTPLMRAAQRGSSRIGLLKRGDTVYMAVAVPIYEETWSQPPAGVLMVSRRLDIAQLRRISEQLGSRAVLSWSTRGDFAEAGNSPHDPRVILRDVSGNPIASLGLAVPLSEVYLSSEVAQMGQRYLIAVSLGIALVASLMMLWFLRVNIWRFLAAIQRLAAGDWESHIPYAARDEFGFLARAFNQMAIQLQQAFEAQEQQREEIQAQNEELHALYQQLQAANQELAQLNAELTEANRALAQAVVTDGLTGLKNHRAFQEALQSSVQMAERLQQPLSLIMLDVDHFKQFNDRFGHPAGDELLRQVAQVLRESARAYDVAARYGGEEFALLLPNTTLEQAVQVAERLRKAIRAIPNPHASVSASLGVASYRFGSAPATLLYEADAALYRAKRDGRDRVCAYQPEAA